MRLVILLMVVTVLMLNACSDSTTSPEIDYDKPVAITPTGQGNSENPYIIENLGNLYWLSQNQEHWDKHYIQTTDIDASYTRSWDEGRGWKPIGFYIDKDNDYPFTGSYDGHDYVIDNLFINRPDTDYQGLFGRTEGALLDNIGTTNVDITGRNRVGGIVGNNRSGSKISNSFSTGSVNGYWCVGGVVGGNWTSSVLNSYSSADVVAGSDNVGGLIGYNGEATVSFCYSTGSVSGKSGNIGGMVGMNVNSEITNSYWNNETSGQYTSSGGEKRTTDEMVFPYNNTFTSWDFDSIWVKDITGLNQGYPYLSWEKRQ